MTPERRDSAITDADRTHLRSAIERSAAAERAGELPYASLLVDASGAVVRIEHNTVLSSGDITAHPELVLARWAALTYPPHQRADLTLYTSCQPCPMCTAAIARAGLGRVVFALSTEQLHHLQPAGFLRPDAAPVRYDGPALPDQAAIPVAAYYRTRVLPERSNP